MTTLKWLLIGGFALYCGLLVLAYFGQRALMYFPERQATLPAVAGLPEAQAVTLTTADGENVIVWHIAARGEKPVVLYFHGNAGALRSRAERFRAITADGTGLVALSYRGYGGSSGSPSEAGFIADAEAAYAFAVARTPPARIAVWGESIGTGVAVAIAAGHPVGWVILEAPFFSAVEIGAKNYPFMPVWLLMRDQFRSDLRIGKVTAPVLVLHGERDAVIPTASSERLYALINGRKRFVRFPEGGHVDLAAHGVIEAAQKFLSEP